MQLFKENAENNWRVVGRNFLNRFHAGNLIIDAFFNKEGHLIYIITYGGKKDMPERTRRRVKSEYFDYTITMAIEVKKNNRDIWIVNLDDAKTQLTVRVEDDVIEEVQQIDKLNNSK